MADVSPGDVRRILDQWRPLWTSLEKAEAVLRAAQVAEADLEARNQQIETAKNTVAALEAAQAAALENRDAALKQFEENKIAIEVKVRDIVNEATRVKDGALAEARKAEDNLVRIRRAAEVEKAQLISDNETRRRKLDEEFEIRRALHEGEIEALMRTKADVEKTLESIRQRL